MKTCPYRPQARARAAAIAAVTGWGLLISQFAPPAVAAPPASAVPDTLPNLRELIRQADFVGFILGSPLISNPAGPWKQGISVERADPIQGKFERNPAINNQFPWVHAGYDNVTGEPTYPTRFAGKGEYLIFLRYIPDSKGGRQGEYATLAAFRVDYRPNRTSGQIVGAIRVSTSHSPALLLRPYRTHPIPPPMQEMSVAEVRMTLQCLTANPKSQNSLVLDSTQRLEKLLRISATTEPQGEPSYEIRLQEVQSLAATIAPGTTREDIDRVFPQEDGGVSDSRATRYYLGSEVMVEVPYDQTGGNWKPENRVTGPVKVYRSSMHTD